MNTKLEMDTNLEYANSNHNFTEGNFFLYKLMTSIRGQFRKHCGCEYKIIINANKCTKFQ